MSHVSHLVCMSENSYKMTMEDLERGYEKLDELAHGLDYNGLKEIFSFFQFMLVES